MLWLYKAAGVLIKIPIFRINRKKVAASGQFVNLRNFQENITQI
ncbi:hypothetical protein D1BOALGB6SA_2995 [Olavius sp. associated proteobacterium Delta 1]|nr:hypothetical protein D1BOALGB6SA_2995 [Olavius sp. associated proteobacterium Delta 1]